MKIEIHIPSKDENCLLKTTSNFKVGLANLQYMGIFVDIIVHEHNKLGLTELYNSVLDEINETKREVDYLFFMHSDVRFDIEHLVSRVVILDGKYDLIGLAGAKKIDLKASPLSWFTASRKDEEGRFGRITQNMDGHVFESFFNQTLPNVEDTDVAAIDGLCMILSKSLIYSDIRFDEKFKFDFYDLDYCLTVMIKNKKKIGVLVEPTFHESCGKSILTEQFLDVEKVFKKKWRIS